MMKKRMIALLCLLLALSLTGCATVTSDNSFQDKAPGEVSDLPPVVQNVAENQPVDAQATQEPTAAPTSDPNAAGFNG